MGLKLRFHADELTSCLLPQGSPAPAELLAQNLTYFFRTRDETTLICPTASVPKNALQQESGWIPIELVGPFAFNETGILAQVANPLAAAGVAILAIVTFGTDYVLIKKDKREAALTALRQAGHSVHE